VRRLRCVVVLEVTERSTPLDRLVARRYRRGHPGANSPIWRSDPVPAYVDLEHDRQEVLEVERGRVRSRYIASALGKPGAFERGYRRIDLITGHR
jgi:hypothetical protein